MASGSPAELRTCSVHWVPSHQRIEPSESVYQPSAMSSSVMLMATLWPSSSPREARDLADFHHLRLPAAGFGAMNTASAVVIGTASTRPIAPTSVRTISCPTSSVVAISASPRW